MKILTADQIKEVDRYTIEHTPISSVDLMERAALSCLHWFIQNIDKEYTILLFCGPGNNGGDGLALARLLQQSGYQTHTWLLSFQNRLSPDAESNLKRLKYIDNELVTEVLEVGQLKLDRWLSHRIVMVDAIFGTGLSRSTKGDYGEIIQFLNAQNKKMVSIDLPSGIHSDKRSLFTGNEIIKASTTLTFQYLKTALVVAENGPFTGNVEVLDIGLLEAGTDTMKIKSFLSDEHFVQSIIKDRPPFSNKGHFGHVLLVAGGKGKMGAGILASQACLRSGVGLLTTLVPKAGESILQSAVAEAMAMTYSETGAFNAEALPPKLNAVGIGPGIGTDACAESVVNQILDIQSVSFILDADALNLLAIHPEWWMRLPENTILTPHPGEFRRLTGEWKNDFEKIELQLKFAAKHRLFLVLKGKYTTIATPDGFLYFNPTGNSGMAKGGSGDVLTGLITGLRSSGYSEFESSVLGVYLHGLAGDLAADELSEEGMKACDIIDYIPLAWITLKQEIE